MSLTPFFLSAIDIIYLLQMLLFSFYMYQLIGIIILFLFNVDKIYQSNDTLKPTTNYIPK